MNQLFKHRLRHWRTVELVRWAEYKQTHEDPYPKPVCIGFMVNAYGVETANIKSPPHTVATAYKRANQVFDEVVKLWKEGGFDD